MTILTKRRPHLSSLGLPPDTEMIKRTRAFVIRAGLTLNELAEMAILNASSLRVFLSGSYDRHHLKDENTLAIRAKLKEVIDRHELGSDALPTGQHYSTGEFETIRRSMLAALRQGTAFLVDGPPGTQKTYTFRRIAAEISESGEGHAVYVYSRVDHAPQAFLVEACTEAGIPNRGSIDQLLRKLRFFLGGKRALLIVDEAQHLSLGALEVLRQLLDMPPFFGVVLGGSHDLSERLVEWQMEQWRSRLRRTLQLKGLSKAEAGRILKAEFGEVPEKFVSASIEDATVEAVRNRVPFRYISARNLFFAIEDARRNLKKSDSDKPVKGAST